MTTYTVADSIINGADRQLHAKMRSALVKLALDIVNEAPSTAYHRVRRRWAERVLASGTSFADRRARTLLALDADIRAGYDADAHTDAAVEAVLSAALPTIIAETL